MASIINAGSGSNAELTEPYTTQAPQHSLLFGIGGEADTKFPLPAGSSWVVVELYFIEANESTIAHTEWFDKLNDISARLIEIQDAIEADSLITNYKIVASHYDHTVVNKVDVYRGEHLDGSARVDIVLTDSDVDFTFPVGNWKLSDTVLAPNREMPTDYEAYWLLKVDGVDESINNHDFTNSNVVFNGSYAYFDGSTNTHLHQTDISGDLTHSKITIGFRIYAEDNTSDNIVSKYEEADPYQGYGIALYIDHMAVWTADDTNFAGWLESPDVQKEVNTWVHYTLVLNGTTCKIYENGIFVSTIINTKELLGTGSGDFKLGSLSGGGEWFKGRLSNVVLYKRVLSDSEIEDVYYSAS